MATIIPILFLAVSIQASFLTKKPKSKKDKDAKDHILSNSILFLWVILFLAEFQALGNVYLGKESAGSFLFAMMAIFGSLVFIIFDARYAMLGKVERLPRVAIILFWILASLVVIYNIIDLLRLI